MPEPDKLIPAAAHEQTDVTGRFILCAVGTVLGALLIITLGVLLAFPYARLDRTLHEPLPDYPSPRLQAAPQDEMRFFRESEMKQLTSTGWIDRAHGVAHIPIDEAMRQIAHEGIPGWPASRSTGR